MNDMLAGRSVMYVVNTDWFFLSHRLPLALRAQSAGARVVVVATDSGRADEIRRHGLLFVDLRMSRIGRNPWREALSLVALNRAVHCHRPDVVHLVATKALVYGGIVARAAGVRCVVSAVTGAGYALGEERGGALQRIVLILLRRVLAWSSVVIFQHQNDLDTYVAGGLVAGERCRIVGGVGVDPAEWPLTPEPAEPVVLLAARMIEDKGIRAFVDVARVVRPKRPLVRFVLVGPLEPELPSAISEEELTAWVEEGLVEWWGPRSDLRETMAKCQVFVLPTFHNEGVPKVLLEAGASGRSVIASNIPGCRAVVDHAHSGLLVPPKDVDALATAVQSLLADPALRQRLASQLHADVLARFRERDLSEATLAIYRDCLSQTDESGCRPNSYERSNGDDS